jgi:hypothetical protein
VNHNLIRVAGIEKNIQTGQEPHLRGMPMLGVTGFAMEGLLGMWLVIYRLRTGRV